MIIITTMKNNDNNNNNSYYHHWKCNFPITPPVRRLDGPSIQGVQQCLSDTGCSAILV